MSSIAAASSRQFMTNLIAALSVLSACSQSEPPARLLAACALVLLVSSVSCTGERDYVSVSVHDSAGVTIVVNTGDPDSWKQWYLSSTPELVLGANENDPDDALFRVVGALRLSDGRVVVGNAGSFELRYYAPDGRFVHSLGNDGSGPGEFRSVDWIAPLGGDSVVVYDSRLHRLTVLDPAGAYVWSTTILPTDQVPVPLVVGLFGDGSALIRDPSPAPERTGVSQVDFRLYRYEQGSSSPQLLGTFAGDERYFRHVKGGVSVYGVPFGRSYVLAVADAVFFHGHNEHPELRAYSRTGQLLRVIRWDAPSIDVTGDAIQDYREEQLDRAGNPDLRRRWEQVLTEIPVAQTMPKFGSAGPLRDVTGLIRDDTGNLWILQYAWRKEQATSWNVFDERGVALATVTLPPGHEPMHVADDLMLLRVRDSLDVETVRLNRISKGGD